ncbi:MAG: CoA transferase [Chloroflexota bacterium]|nr:CoA transferase [Chloroflexota bacterium]
MESALKDVRILDLSRALAGPYGSMLLADLGAEVIKVEAPRSRRDVKGPFAYKGMDAYFMGVNRNKKSIVIDLTKAAGRHVFYDLAKVSDVVFDNFRPEVPKKLGIDYETLKGINPRIISCSITGFGPTGPYRDRPAYDLCVQALGGGVAITGDPDGPPVRNGVAVADQGAGLLAAAGILAALHARERTGVGQRVETSLLEAMIYQLAYEVAIYTVSGMVPGRIGSRHLVVHPYGIFQTSDDYIAVAAPLRFPALCQAIGRPDLAADPRFDRFENLALHQNELYPALEEVFLTRTTGEWLQTLEESDIPCAPVNPIDKVLADPQVVERQMVVDVEHVRGGAVKLVGNALEMSATPADARREFTSPPLLGQHTEEVLAGLLGYSQEQIGALRQEEAIG